VDVRALDNCDAFATLTDEERATILALAEVAAGVAAVGLHLGAYREDLRRLAMSL
jgi:VENN motif-containing pre-toxin protein